MRKSRHLKLLPTLLKSIRFVDVQPKKIILNRQKWLKARKIMLEQLQRGLSSDD